jgi:hypothetical protein
VRKAQLRLSVEPPEAESTEEKYPPFYLCEALQQLQQSSPVVSVLCSGGAFHIKGACWGVGEGGGCNLHISIALIKI